MSKLMKCVLSALLAIMLGCVWVNARENIVLTQDSPDATVSSGESVTIYGTSDANHITVESGADVELVHFPGNNTVSIESDSEGFTVSRSGAVVTFEGEDGTVLKIPATQTAQFINFTDQASLTLSMQVKLGDQVVTTTAASIDSSSDDGGSEVTSECGAYIAPGVWKEFDCYNLAAIGKTTGDDPFTPSWRLIGGYWQWGRKGPDESKWYDTNTINFAHGPTGPDASETNEMQISGWDADAPDGAWSDTEKKENDPCPSGYRVPSKAQWEGVKTNNATTPIGPWNGNSTDYSTAYSFGESLMLPTAGDRDPSSHYSHSPGSLMNRGYTGYYWSSSQGSDEGQSYYFGFRTTGSVKIFTAEMFRSMGSSLRCIAE